MEEHTAPSEVVVTDIHIPFWSMVGLMIKWTLAAIPAVIILLVAGGLFGSVLTSLNALANLAQLVGK